MDNLEITDMTDDVISNTSWFVVLSIHGDLLLKVHLCQRYMSYSLHVTIYGHCIDSIKKADLPNVQDNQIDILSLLYIYDQLLDYIKSLHTTQ